MGVLKVRVGGSWVSLNGYGTGPPGGPVPVGGVAGDIIVKVSASDFDVRWGTDPPKLTLTATGQASLSSTGHAFQVGSTGSQNLIADQDGVQARSSGSANSLYLNEYGGAVMVGAGGLNVTGMMVANNNEALRMPTAAQFVSFWNGGTRLGYLQGNTNGLILNSETGGLTLAGVGGVTLNPFTINGYTGSEGVIGSRVVLANASGYIFGNYFNMTANQQGDTPSHIAGMVSSDGFLRWFHALHASKIAWGATASRIESTKVSGGQYYDQGYYANAATTMAGYGWHPGGTAGSIKMQQNVAQFHFHNVDGSGYYECVAFKFTPVSSQRYKQEMSPLVDVLPPTPRHPVATMVRALRPTWFRAREEITMREVPPCPDDVEPHDWHPDIAMMPNHVCRIEGKNACGHTPDDPCSWRVNWQRGQLGFVAEEVEQVLPQLVSLDVDMQPQGIDLGSLIGLAYAMLQELDARLGHLEGATA